MKRSKYILIAGLAVLATALASCEKEEAYYRIYFPENPASTFSCEETVITSRIVTNVPQSDLIVEAPSWITATIDSEGSFRVQIARNETNRFRDAEVVVSDRKGRAIPISWSLQQAYVIRNGKGMVQFADCAFKTVVLELADTNMDYDISPEEAQTVEEIVAPGKGIRDISGIEAFNCLWKLDLQDNDIQDASLITSLPKLHWLDLKGNRNLKTFDVRGCSEYFNHCEFEITDNLLYYCWDRQVNICTTSDPNGEHSKHIFDDRKTTDWSRQNRLVELKKHTEGDGRIVICLTGLGWLDTDLEDGTYDRVMRESYDAILTWPWIKGHEEKIDFYKGLAIYILPEGVTNYFDVVDFNEQPAKDHGKLYKTELHIYLDEKDNRPEGFDGVKSNGFGEERMIYDFPVRNRKTILHVRRRRWLTADGKSVSFPLEEAAKIVCEGTSYSKELALFLKRADGQ